MKRLFLILLLCGGLLIFVGNVTATQIDLYENFYGTGYDDNYIDLWEGDSVTLHFDLTATNSPSVYPFPTTDESAFNPATQTILSGVLDFTFSSRDLQDETVVIKAGFYDGGQLIEEIDYDLGSLVWNPWPNLVREYATLSIDLAAEGLLSYLQDGQFDTIVLSPNVSQWWEDNDIRLDQSSLTATAAPVPEPTTILLSGLGLLGMGAYLRRKRSKK